MSDQITLAAEARERVGKGASRALRRQGRVPAVVYGQNRAPDAIHVEEKALTRALGTGHFMNSVVLVGGARTLPKDVAFDPVTDRPVHVDFLRIDEHARVTVAVPVVFANEADAPGLQNGGVLEIVRHEVELVVDAAEIPSEIVVDLTGRQLGESIHIGSITLPGGATPATADRDFTLATIGAPSADRPEGADAETPGAELQAMDAGITPTASEGGEQAGTDATGGGEGRSE